MSSKALIVLAATASIALAQAPTADQPLYVCYYKDSACTERQTDFPCKVGPPNTGAWYGSRKTMWGTLRIV